jgi:hypothetical protein
METTIRTKQYDGEIILPNLTSEAGAKTYGPPCIIVHLDNARPSNSRQSCECLEGFRVRRVPHPLYSPNVTQNYFFLFGHLKIKLAGLVIQSKEELISMIRQIFDEIPRERLIFVYLL